MATITIEIPEELLQRLRALCDTSLGACDALLVAAIEDVVTRRDAELAARDKDAQQLRETAGHHAWSAADYEAIRSRFATGRNKTERDAILRSIRMNETPLSQTVIELRDEERR